VSARVFPKTSPAVSGGDFFLVVSEKQYIFVNASGSAAGPRPVQIKRESGVNPGQFPLL
jgi:hypothetical protein